MLIMKSRFSELSYTEGNSLFLPNYADCIIIVRRNVRIKKMEHPRNRIRRAGYWFGSFLFGLLAIVGILIALHIKDWELSGTERVGSAVLIGFCSLVGGVIGSEFAWRMFLRRTSTDTGWSALERSKELWQLGSDLAPAEWYGRINPKATTYRASPRICKAKALLRSAIDHAPASNQDTIQAKINEAVAVRELGLLHRAINEFEEAREAYNKSLHILDGLGGITSTSRDVLSAYRETVFRIGELSHALGNYNAAAEKYNESLKVDDILGHDDLSGEQYTSALLQQIQNRT